MLNMLGIEMKLAIKYPQAIYHLNKILGMVGRHDEVVDLCDEGKKVCLETAWLSYIPYIEINRACSLYELGAVSKCAELLRDIYCTCRLQDLYTEMDKIENYAKSKGIVF